MMSAVDKRVQTWFTKWRQGWRRGGEEAEEVRRWRPCHVCVYRVYVYDIQGMYMHKPSQAGRASEKSRYPRPR
jgi:hypothetical protein